MRLAMVVNDALELGPEQTTTLMLHSALQRGHEVWLVGAADLGMAADTRVVARGRKVVGPAAGSARDLLAAVAEAPLRRVDVTSCDVILLRTSPARDQERKRAHETALQLATIARDQGVVVANDPDGLTRASSKLYLTHLPAHIRPTTIVSNDREYIGEFIAGRPGPCVLKPLQGTRGQDVFLVGADDVTNLNQIIDVVTRSGHAMVQDFVPEAARGDTRVILLDGHTLTAGGAPAAVRRVPGEKDFRSNVHIGGTPAPGEVTEAMQAAIADIGPIVRRDGLLLVGVDFVGAKVVELNVFSPGGLFDAGRFAGVDFVTPILEHLEGSPTGSRERRPG